MTRMSSPSTDANWWRQAVVYQVYPRSFVDLNGDGIGDLAGITSRADYLAALGVDAVWLSPFYPSALADGGYDVADYRDVDPKIGTLEDFDRMLAALHDRGIRLFVDLVPNHSSDLHPWFQEALTAAPGDPARDRYIFREGRGEHGELPPNDWPSHWGPSCWTRVADGSWYLHLFAPEQPDFNWDNAEVRADFLRTIRFWADRGIDGFRIDVAHGLCKDMSEPFAHLEGLQPQFIPSDGTHPLFDREELLDVYREWRKVFDSYEPPIVAVGEVGASPERRPRYTAPDTLHQAFNFELIEDDFTAAAFRESVDAGMAAASAGGSSSTWVLSNHDVIRHASRYGLPLGTDGNDWLLSGGVAPEEDVARGLARARAATLFILALPGSVYMYQGEELGLREVADLPVAVLQDPMWLRSNHTAKGRDGCRVPLPWTATGATFGFGADRAHLPQPAWFGEYAVDVQEAAAESTLAFYRRSLALRRTLQTDEVMEWIEAPADVLHFRRPNGWHCVTNFGNVAVTFDVGQALLSSGPLTPGVLPGNTTVWYREG